MFQRMINPSLSQSFFIFGPRGSGKTTFLKEFFKGKSPLWIDLLDAEQEERFALDPGLLYRELTASTADYSWVVIDEIQKNPRLLDTVHRLIENSPMKFALTGSSARQLKRGSANLLAGRAFVNYLFPLTHGEMKTRFDLSEALHWGTLPRVVQLSSLEDKKDYLKAYAFTYLKEEIWSEHLVRQLDPFRRFLPVAAQTCGQIVNYSNVARDVGVDYKTVQSYFQILEDTLVGFMLEPFHRSIRKQQQQSPKFYLFDTGVKRALDHSLDVPLQPRSYAFGNAFEHWLVAEIYRLNHYHKKDYQLSYLRTKDQAEIDLIVERPGRPTALIEIKSTDRCDPKEARKLDAFLDSFPKASAYLLSLDPHPQKIGRVEALPWDRGVQLLFEVL